MKNLHFIRDEMLTHIPLCTHAAPRRVLVVGGCENLQNELDKHKDLEEIVHINAEDALSSLQELGSKRFDIAIVADDRFGANRDFWIQLTKLLEEKGIAVAPMSNLISEEEQAKKELQLLGGFYQILMPYRYEKEDLTSGYMLLASRFYHPTADLNLQRADLTDGFAYYNSDIAIAAFQTPTFIKQNYLGIIKR